MNFLSAGGNRLWQGTIAIFFLTLFFEASRLLDIKNIQFMAVLFGLLAIGLLASRRILAFLKPMAGKIMPLFVGWFLLAYFLSEHTQLSPLYLKGVLQGTLLFIAAASLLTTISDFQKLFQVLAAAGLVLSALSLAWGMTLDGRHSLRTGEYSDPNLYAMALLGLTPIIWAAIPARTTFMKVVAVGATAFPVLTAIRTLSRGGFAAMLVMIAVLFFLISFKARMILAGVLVVGLVGLVAFLPPSLRNRLAVAARLAPADEAPGQSESAVSLQSRETLFTTSINVTLAFPLLGAGPGNFGPMIAAGGQAEGQKWINMNTHNGYTQISSETGIPGLLFYVVLMALSFYSVIQVRRETEDPEARKLAGALLVSLAATFTCMIFLSEGYSALALFWLGLANGLHRVLPEAIDEGEEEIGELTDGLEHAS